MADAPKITLMIDKVSIETISTLEALSELEALYQFRQADPSNGRAILVTGESRTGKTRWATNSINAFAENGRPQILYVQVPANPTLKAVATAILNEMNDPFAHKTRGNTSEITDRVANLFKEIGYAAIILDEAHHVAPMGKKQVIWEATEWLKSLMNKGVFMVLVGLPDLQRIVGGNPQLQNRTIGHARFTAVDYESTMGRTFIKDLVKQYDAILSDKKIGFPVPSNLIDFADRLATASSGQFGRLSTLVQRAAIFAASNPKARSVGLRELEKAFDSVNLDNGWSVPNPFRQRKTTRAEAA